MAPDHLILVGGVVVVAGCLAAAIVGSRRVARHLYWWSWFIGISVISCAFADRGWRMAAAAVAVGLIAAVCVAYMRTPFLKIGNTIHAYTLVDSRPDPPAQAPPPPPDAYAGLVTARKVWWTLAIFSIAAAASALRAGLSGTTVGIGAVLATMLLVTGHLDVRDGFPVARKQKRAVCGGRRRITPAVSGTRAGLRSHLLLARWRHRSRQRPCRRRHRLNREFHAVLVEGHRQRLLR